MHDEDEDGDGGVRKYKNIIATFRIKHPSSAQH